jgi:hypothetical protein
MKNNVAMGAAALVFLEDPIARRLAVAWVACKGKESRWLETAGLLPGRSVEALCTMLRENGICRAGGVTDALALSYVAALTAAKLKRGKGH